MQNLEYGHDAARSPAGSFVYSARPEAATEDGGEQPGAQASRFSCNWPSQAPGPTEVGSTELSDPSYS